MLKDSNTCCASCLQSKPSLKSKLQCGVCECLLCKDCVQFLEEDHFSFLKEPAEELKHKTYCRNCYDEKVMPAHEAYLELMERAKQVYVFFKKHNIPLIRKSKHWVSVQDCPDREEALLRLAFFAAEQSFNALVEANLISEKRFVNGYQSLIWHGKAYPAEIRVAGLEENRFKEKEKPQPERIRKKKGR